MIDEPDPPPMVHLRLDAPLPCGMPACGRPTRSAMAEPDPDHPGLWQVLPLCDECRNRYADEPPSLTAAGSN